MKNNDNSMTLIFLIEQHILIPYLPVKSRWLLARVSKKFYCRFENEYKTFLYLNSLWIDLEKILYPYDEIDLDMGCNYVPLIVNPSNTFLDWIRDNGYAITFNGDNKVGKNAKNHFKREYKRNKNFRIISEDDQYGSYKELSEIMTDYGALNVCVFNGNCHKSKIEFPNDFLEFYCKNKDLLNTQKGCTCFRDFCRSQNMVDCNEYQEWFPFHTCDDVYLGVNINPNSANYGYIALAYNLEEDSYCHNLKLTISQIRNRYTLTHLIIDKGTDDENGILKILYNQ